MSGFFKRFWALIPFLFILSIVTLSVHLPQQPSTKKSQSDSLWVTYKPLIDSIFPIAETIKLNERKIKTIFDKKNNPLGIILISNECNARFYGYGGEIVTALIIDKDNIIKSVKVLKENETPAFYNRVEQSGLIRIWENKTITNAKNLQIDAVSGATITSQAIKGSVKKMLAWYLNDINKKDKIKWNNILINISLFIILFFGLISYIWPSQLKKYRLILHFTTIIIIGLFAGNFISASLLFAWLNHGISFYAAPFLVITFLVSIILPLLTGKSFYCNFICPYGACQELAGKIPVKKTILQSSLSKLFRQSKKVIFISVLLFVILLGEKMDLSYIEPFQAFLFKSAPWFMIAGALLFILISIFINRPWCNYFCFTGQFFEMIRKPYFSFSKKTEKRKISFDFALVTAAFILAIVIKIFLLYQK